MRTAIVTDSNSGISEEEGEKTGVFVLPMPVIIDGVSYYEGKDLSHEQFFHQLCENKPVSTSQPDVGEVLSMWNRVLSGGYDELVYIPMSSGLSGSCMTAQGLALEYEGRVEVADNHRISVTLRHAVEDAIFLRDQGCTAREIRESLEANAYHSIVYVGVHTLDYLKASGRVTAAGAAIGTILSINPLLVIKGGRLDAYARVRGARSCQMRLVEVMQEWARELSAEGGAVQIGAAGSFADSSKAAAWEEMVRDAFPGYSVKYDPLTFSIASHVGPDAFGMGISRVMKN